MTNIIDDIQLWLWSDLDGAIRNSSNGYLTIGAESAVHRLVRVLSEIPQTAPSSPTDIAARLTAFGIYDAVLERAGRTGPTLRTSDFLGIMALANNQVGYADPDRTVRKIKEMDLS